MQIAELSDTECMTMRLQASQKWDAISELAQLLWRNGRLDCLEDYVAAVREREEQVSTGVGMGIAIPHGKCSAVRAPSIAFASADPLRVIPSQVAGSAVAGALSMLFGCELMAPHGGIFVLPLIKNPILYLVAMLAGVAVTTLLVIALKPDLKAEQLEGADLSAVDLG